MNHYRTSQANWPRSSQSLHFLSSYRWNILKSYFFNRTALQVCLFYRKHTESLCACRETGNKLLLPRIKPPRRFVLHNDSANPSLISENLSCQSGENLSRKFVEHPLLEVLQKSDKYWWSVAWVQLICHREDWSLSLKATFTSIFFHSKSLHF